MIALLLGLIVILGAVTVFLSNKQSYRTNLALGQVQENARVAFDLIARELLTMINGLAVQAGFDRSFLGAFGSLAQR